MKTMLLVLALSLLTACSIQPEGIGFAVPQDEEDWKKMEDQLLANRELARAAGIIVDGIEPGVLVVGRVGPYRDFESERRFANDYKHYRRRMTAIGHGAEIISEAELRSMADGWTTITHAGIPQLGFLMSRAYVTPEVASDIGFSNPLGTFLLGTREDLVAGVMTVGFPFFRVTHLLCADGAGYLECTRQYDSGFYDVYTGKQLNTRMELKERGPVIDTTTFKELK